MNTVRTEGETTTVSIWNREQLADSGETAFIGVDPNGVYRGLFLIIFYTVVFASDPDITWSSGSPAFQVDEFVDVEMVPRPRRT